MQPTYPELQFSSPTQIAQVDASTPDALPTKFTQDMVRYGDYASTPDLGLGQRQSWLSVADELPPPPRTWGDSVGDFFSGVGSAASGALDSVFKGRLPQGVLDAGDQFIKGGSHVSPYGAFAPTGQTLEGLNLGNSSLYEGDNPVARELARPANYLFGAGQALPLIAGNSAMPYAEQAAEPLISQLPEGAQPYAHTGVGIAAQLGTFALTHKLQNGAIGAATRSAEAEALNAASPAEYGRQPYEDLRPYQSERGIGGGALTPEEERLAALRERRTGLAPDLDRTNKLRAARGLDPLVEPPAAWGGTEAARPTSLDNAVRELHDRVAREGMTPQNRQAYDELAAQVFKNDVPAYAQEPAAVRPGSDGERIGQAIIDRAEAPKTPEIAQIEAIQNAGEGFGGAVPPREPPIGGAPPPPEGGSQASFGGMELPKPPATTFGQRLGDVLSAPMSAKSTYDLSAPGRQLAPMLYGHPTAIPGVLRAQTRALLSRDAFEAAQEALRKSPNAVYRELAGVELGGITGGLQREEQIGSNLAAKILPKSERFNDAYTAAINEGRNWLFDQMLAKMNPADLTEAGLRNGGIDQLKQIGRLVNASTGRGDLMGLLTKGSVAEVAGQPLLWAPKLLAGRVQLPASMFSSNPIVRNEAARQMAAFVGVNTAVLGMIKASGVADVELDPRSSDFGEIRIGNRRFDPWAGYKPMVNLIVRLGVSAKDQIGETFPQTGLASDTPNVKRINTPAGAGGLYSKDALNVVGDFLRAKLAPVPGEVWNQAIGKAITGADVTQPIGNAGGKVAGRAEHAVAGLLAPIFLESLGQELGYTVPRGYEQGGVGGALAEVGKSALANIPYAGGVGGGYYTPSPEDRAAQGEFGTLNPTDQFKAIPTYTWGQIKESPDFKAEVGDFGSFSDWKSDWVKRASKQWASEANPTTGRPVGDAEALRQAELIVQRQPIAKAYAVYQTALENWWYENHPNEGQQRYEEQMQLPGPDRRNLPTKEQRGVLAGATR